jgi:hypothetical protein
VERNTLAAFVLALDPARHLSVSSAAGVEEAATASGGLFPGYAFFA